jgi:hypothetical protein
MPAILAAFSMFLWVRSAAIVSFFYGQFPPSEPRRSAGSSANVENRLAPRRFSGKTNRIQGLQTVEEPRAGSFPLRLCAFAREIEKAEASERLMEWSPN